MRSTRSVDDGPPTADDDEYGDQYADDGDGDEQEKPEDAADSEDFESIWTSKGEYQRCAIAANFES